MIKQKTTDKILENTNNFKHKKKEYIIYVIENDIYNIKIGITSDFDQRLKSLSNSNSGGHKILRTYESPKTYLYTLERIMHMHFQQYRIEGEWFHTISFEEVVDYLKELMNTKEYIKANEIRAHFFEKPVLTNTDPKEKTVKMTVENFSWNDF